MTNINEINKAKLYDEDVFYIGNLPSNKCIFITSGKEISLRNKETIFVSALEALLNGYDIAYIPFLGISKIIEKAALETEKGSLFAFVPQDLSSVSKKKLSSIILTGGGMISLGTNEEEFSLSLLRKTECFASSFSLCTLVSDENLLYMPEYITSALDNGKLVALTKESLSSKVLHFLSFEGAPVVSSFCSLLTNPEYMLYPKRNGKYGLNGKDYDILNLRNGK